MTTSISAPPYSDSGQFVPTANRMIKIRAGEKVSASGVNGAGPGEVVPNGVFGDNARALNEIQLALSNITSNLGKLVPVERQHVVPPAIAALVHIVFLVLIRQPSEIVISAIFLTIMLSSFAWPVWTTLKPMHRQIDEINVKMDVLHNSIQSIESAVSLRPDYVPIVHPIAQPIEPREAPQPVEPLVNVEEPKPYVTSVTPEPERIYELSPIMDPIDPVSVAFEPIVFVEPPATTDRPDPIQAPVEPKVPDEPPATINEPDSIPARAEPNGKDKQNVDSPIISISPPPEPPTAGRVEQDVAVSVEQHSQQPGRSLGDWSSTLFEIKQKIDPLASDTLQRLPRLDQREPVDLVSQRRVVLRLLMYCASLPTAEFASPHGFLGHPTSVPYYPTGDLEGDRNVAFTTALDCLDELTVILTGDAKAEIAGSLSELAQALNDLGLHDYASSVSGFALEIYRELYAAEPDQFRSRIASVQSLRANILVDLGKNDDAAGAAEEAVTILKERGDTQPELVYAMLNYAVLLGSTGRGEGAAAVAFELMGYIDDSTIMQPDIILVSPLCQLCVSTACTEFDSDLALTEADKAIEASRASLDANSKVVLAGALLAKSKLLSSNGQNDVACSISTEAVTLFRRASVDRHVFSLLLANALFANSHQLSEANRKGESYTTIHEAVEIWQTVQISSPVASKRPLAWALFELAKYRNKGADKQKLRNELQIAETAVSTFRDVSPPDYAGLADALFLYADRMLELDKNREAATFAEESVQYFKEAREESPHKYALDLIFSLSLASSCLACTERSADALEYAKQAVKVQHERESDKDPQYVNHLRKLLMDVIFRSTEMGMQQDAMPWMQELQQLGDPENENPTGQLARRGGKPQTQEFKKETSYWMDSNNSAPKVTNGSGSSAGMRTPTPTPTPALDKGKGKEVTPSAGSRSPTPTPRVDKGKAKEVTPANPFSPSSDARRLSVTEEILSPGAAAAAQRRRDALAGMGSPQGGPFGSVNNNDLLSSLLGGMGGMGGRTLGGASGPPRSGNNNDPLSGLFGAMGGMGGMGGRNQGPPSSPPPMGPSGRPLGSPIPQTARAPPPTARASGRMSGMAGLESLLGGLGGHGPGGGLGGLGRGGFDPGMFGPGSDKYEADVGNTGTGTEGGGDDTPRSGTWSGMGIQSKLSDDSP